MNIKEINKKIINILPYNNDFLFVKELSFIDDNEIHGNYIFSTEEKFYHSHFKHIPVIPGVILIEMMGQIGSVSHLIFLQELYKCNMLFHPVLTFVEAEFYKQALYNEPLYVISKKTYYKNKYLKSKIRLYDSFGGLCASSTIQATLIFDPL